MDDNTLLGVDAVSEALSHFALWTGITDEELACYEARQCQHLMRKFLACQTSTDRASPQKVLALVAHDEVARLEYETAGSVWGMAKDMEFPPVFYTYVASNVQFSPEARKNVAFRRFGDKLNRDLPRDAQMNDREVFLMYHVLNVPNARAILMHHFDADNVAEVNRVHNTMLKHMREEHLCDAGKTFDARNRTGDALGSLINGLSFPMFAAGKVYIGAAAATVQEDKASTEQDLHNHDEKQMGSFPLELAVASPGEHCWSPTAEGHMVNNEALQQFWRLSEQHRAFSRSILWRQAMVSAVVPASRRSNVPMNTLKGRKQNVSDIWKNGVSWIKNLTFEQWDDLWKQLEPHFSASTVLTSTDRGKTQTQVLYNALCTELGQAKVRGDYTPNDMLRLMITTHLPEEYWKRLLTSEQSASRATLHALHRYLAECPHVGRAILQALCEA